MKRPLKAFLARLRSFFIAPVLERVDARAGLLVRIGDAVCRLIPIEQAVGRLAPIEEVVGRLPRLVEEAVGRLVPIDQALGRIGVVSRLNPYLTTTNWDIQRPLVEPHLAPGGLVLDVGSGHYPCPRATILADFYSGATIHRNYNPVVEDRPLVVCSIDRMPFATRAFDFVICSHVLEHLDSPRRAVAELARVARAGYCETPAYGKDILVGTGNMHRWQVVEFEGTLHFFEYSKRQKEAHVRSPVMDLWTQPTYHPWQDFFWQRQDLFNARLLWTEPPPQVVEHRRPNSQAAGLPGWRPVDPALLPLGPCALTPEEVGVLTRVLTTPDGSRPMTFQDGNFVAEGGIVYPVREKRVYCEVGS
jgi:SAM-dependent methyltransferase